MNEVNGRGVLDTGNERGEVGPLCTNPSRDGGSMLRAKSQTVGERGTMRGEDLTEATLLHHTHRAATAVVPPGPRSPALVPRGASSRGAQSNPPAIGPESRDCRCAPASTGSPIQSSHHRSPRIPDHRIREACPGHWNSAPIRHAREIAAVRARADIGNGDAAKTTPARRRRPHQPIVSPEGRIMEQSSATRRSEVRARPIIREGA